MTPLEYRLKYPDCNYCFYIDKKEAAIGVDKYCKVICKDIMFFPKGRAKKCKTYKPKEGDLIGENKNNSY